MRVERIIVGLILAGYMVLAITISLGPIFEGPDEIEHYRYIRALTHKFELPDPYTQQRAQYHQAPLYYALMSPLAALLDDSDFKQIDGRSNPYYPFEIAFPGNDNKNLYLHTRAESFPYADSPTARSVHLLRLLSVALGVGTVGISYAIFRLLWPDQAHRRLMALGVVAFMPQFLYMSSVISNDSLLFVLCTLALYLLLRRDGPTWRMAAAVGMVLGAVLLTKSSALFMAIPAGVWVITDRRTWRYVPLVLALVFGIAGWWYLRNFIVYGDLTGVKVVHDTWQGEMIRAGQLALDVGLPRLPYSYQTFWARFGNGAVAVGPEVYTFFDALVIVALGGLGLKAIRKTSPPYPLPTAVERGNQKLSGHGKQAESSVNPLRARGVNYAIVAAMVAAWIGMLVIYSGTSWSGNQGRYVLPAVAAIAAVLATGLDAWSPARFKMQIALSVTALLAAVAALCVFGYFGLAYQVWSVPERIEKPLAFRYSDSAGEVAELIGMSPAAPRARPGEVIRINLYWRALRAGNTKLQSYLHSVESAVVRRDSLPATGNLLASDWQAGQTWAESYLIRIPAEAETQIVDGLIAGLYDPERGAALPAKDNTGKAVTPLVGRIAINGASDPTPNEPYAYRFGSEIGLAVPELRQTGERLEVCLRWHVLAAVPMDYTIFVHAAAPSEKPFAQADVQPKGGRYPTSVWQPGETIPDCVTLEINNALAAWQVAIGMYDARSGNRVPLVDAKGERLPNDQIVLPSAIR